MSQTRLELLHQLSDKWSGEKVLSINRLPVSGSKREYYRITTRNGSVIGAINEDREENEAFITFSEHFRSKGLAVPEIYLTDLDNHAYLLEDLGDTTLFDHLIRTRDEDQFSQQLMGIYQKVLSELPRFQIIAGSDLNYDVCYPRSEFDRQSMQWDLSYFKYYFLKLADIPFNEQRLEDDFNRLIDYLLKQDTGYFLYRDFQSRNIMLKDDTPYFIDYQGGRRGALQYDVASLLFDSKADIPYEIRELLLDYYIRILDNYISVNREEFRRSYYAYVLIRMMQAMGAFGFRGFYEKKTQFLQSIPYALKDLKWILGNVELPLKVPTLVEVFQKLLTSRRLKRFKAKEGRTSTLTVFINSFSYLHGIPEDPSGHGGGFVFDCRAISNPGRIAEYMEMTGKDKPVVDFLSQKNDVNEFLSNALALVDLSVENYEERNFSNLMVSFGCTGGQHRSVYCAERLAVHLRESQPVEVILWHRELD